MAARSVEEHRRDFDAILPSVEVLPSQQNPRRHGAGKWVEIRRKIGKEPYVAPGNIDPTTGEPDLLVDPPDLWYEWEPSDDDGDDITPCPDARTDHETYVTWYLVFRWVHRINFVFMAAATITISVLAGVGELTGRGKTTTDFLRSNPAAPPPFASQLKTLDEPHLYYMVITLGICGLWHLLHAFPMHWFGYCFPSKGGKNKNSMGEDRAWSNRIYDNWYDRDVVHEHAGHKHMWYASAYAIMVWGMGIVVGVTNIFIQCALVVAAFVAQLGLWYMESGNARALQIHFDTKMRIANSPELQAAERQVPGTMDTALRAIRRPIPFILPYMIALICELFVIGILFTYFGFVVSCCSDDVAWFVYLTFSWYAAWKLLWEYPSIILFHFDVPFFRCYLYMELIHQVGHAITFLVIVCCIVFGAMNKGLLYE